VATTTTAPSPGARITFVLPTYAWAPTGGFAVVYEHASRLVARGHAVTVLHPFTTRRRVRSPVGHLDRAVWEARIRRNHRPLAPWHPVDPRVRLRLVGALDPARLPAADVLVATAWQTAAPVAAAPARAGRPLHLVQAYEDWSGTGAQVDDALRLPVPKVVIAGWLGDLVRELAPDALVAHVPNGLDVERFGVDVPPAARRPRVGLLWHWLAAKGTDVAIEALARVRAVRGDVEAVAFGIRAAPEGLPDWLEYVHAPSPAALRALYNGCAVFVQASHHEGWGLTATEAMLCGCALVTTDNGGSRDYAFDGRTALVAPPGDPAALAERVLALLADADRRAALAAAGREHAASLTWERAADAFERVLLGDPATALAP